MAKYLRKPNLVDAFKWTGDVNQTEDPAWIVNCLNSGVAKIYRDTDEYNFYDGGEPKVQVSDIWMGIVTLEGTMRADQGDYIIKGIQGEIYPCKPDIFEATYEIVEEDND